MTYYRNPPCRAQDGRPIIRADRWGETQHNPEIADEGE